jgi:hypothetical protein
MDETKKRKVQCPITPRDGKPYLMDMGTATVWPDGSISIELDALPFNGRLVVKKAEVKP